MEEDGEEAGGGIDPKGELKNIINSKTCNVVNNYYY